MECRSTPTKPGARVLAAGFTLIEVMVAVLVLGIVLLAATPQLSTGNSGKLELAASEVAAAIRFARSEALRTREVHAVFVEWAVDRVTVEKTDLSTKPASAEAVLYHPIAKQPYQFNIAEGVTTRGVVIDNAGGPFQFATAGDKPRVMFDGSGVPIFVDTVTDTTYLLSSAEVKLALGDLYRRVVVHPFTGRVAIQ